MNLDLRFGVINLTEIVGREFNSRCSDILLEARQLRGAGTIARSASASSSCPWSVPEPALPRRRFLPQ
jgi:hypothetical protein